MAGLILRAVSVGARASENDGPIGIGAGTTASYRFMTGRKARPEMDRCWFAKGQLVVSEKLSVALSEGFSSALFRFRILWMGYRRIVMNEAARHDSTELGVKGCEDDERVPDVVNRSTYSCTALG